MSEKTPSRRGSAADPAMSAWSLRRRVTVAVAVPLLLAGTFAGLWIRDDLAAAADVSASASRAAVMRSSVSVLALLAALVLAVILVRRTLDPIRRVREGALHVAHAYLPDAVARIRDGGQPAVIRPIDVPGGREVTQLARAIDDLHRQAVALASGEARTRTQVSEMLVTLSRRNTALIEQQLTVLEALEADEEDPGTLESLFRLDHLAARMRRTADSLLVLADAPSRPTGHTDVTVAEVLQAATAAVGDYARVRVWSDLRNRVCDEAAGDVVHLLTELVDNALAASDQDATVRLDATPRPDGSILVDVTDSGPGLDEVELCTLNATLRSGGEMTPDTAQRMGLFVVSRLAARHGITASLRRNDDQGLTASVFLPASILRDVAGRDELPAPVGLRAVPDAEPEPNPDREPVAAELEQLPVRPVASTDVLGAPLVAVPQSTDDGDIFTALRSAWLSSDAAAESWRPSVIEQGWQRAEVVAQATEDAEAGPLGLPVRRPGARLVPGGVGLPAVVATRNADAIRARLAAHAAGVSRGRSAATGEPEHPEGPT